MQKAWYFSKEPNFGDLLNRNILSLFNPSIEYVSRAKCNLIAIGSVLQSFVTRRTLIRKIRKAFSSPVNVWGSGFLSNYTKRGAMFRKPMVFHALRGKLGKALCERLLGHEIKNVCLGDPGLLAWKLLDKTVVKPAFDVGIVPHYVDSRNELLKKIQLSKYSSTILDVTGDPLDVLASLASCKVILSSAMHGLIVADSLGIPNGWISFDSHDLRNEYFKFYDYYSVYDEKMHNPIRLEQTIVNDDCIEQIVENYAISREKVFSLCHDLEEAFPRF